MPRRIFHRLLLVCLLVPALPGVAPAADDLDEASAARSIETLLAEDLTDVRGIWRLSDALAGLDKAGIRPLREAVEGADAPRRLAIGRALIQLDDHLRGLEILQELVEDESGDATLKTAALSVIGQEGELDHAEWLEDRLDVTFDPVVKMAMAKALWTMNYANKGKGKEVLLAFLRSTDADLRAEGALALGEIGAAGEARPILMELREEPTERGRSAAFLLEILGLEQAMEQGLRTPLPDPVEPIREDPLGDPLRWPLLDEISRLLDRYYLDKDDIDRDALEDAMATGITEALDPFTAFLNAEEHARMREGLDPTYGGVGAYVYNDPNNAERFTISRPIWGGPVYRAGLRTGDIVMDIDGTSTEGLSVEACVRLLKGPPGSDVVINIFRPGWNEPRPFTLTRARITIPTTAYDVLPGDIGFLQILSFAQETGREVGEVLDRFDALGVKGIILDLRFNGGGYLQSAVEIASHFLPPKTVVVSEKGRPGAWRDKTHESLGTGVHRRQVPVTILINQGTASAAEILAGSLQVHGRARLVGTMSFGKGSVQRPVDLATRPGETFEDQVRQVPESYTDRNGNDRPDPGEPVRHRRMRNGRYDPPERFADVNGNSRWDPGEEFDDDNLNGLWDDGEPFTDGNGNGVWDPGANFKLTVAGYYLPDGRRLKRETEVVDGQSVTTGGLEPDVDAEPEPLDYWEVQAQRTLEGEGAVTEYVDGLFEGHPDLMTRLARSDERDSSLYPGFDEMYEALDTRLSRDAVRFLVRFNVRRHIGDDLGRELVGDLVDDPMLQAAVRDLFDTLGLSLVKVAGLSFLERDAEGDGSDTPVR